MVKHTQLGQLLLDLNSVELGENWYPLETAKKSKHGQIDIRLTIIFRETAILPSDKYTKLLDMLLDLSSNFKIIMIIATSKRVKGKEMIEFSQLFTKIAEFRGIAPAMVTSLLLYDVQNAESVETLFRGNSMGTKALDFYMKLVASRWLDCLRPIVQNILATEFNCEAREGKLAPEDSLDSNLKNLENYFTLTIQAIFASVRECPISLRKICYHIRNAVQETYPDDPIVPYTAVTGFIFLRFFVPAIMTPKLFGLAGEFYTGTADRTFTLVASLVQKLANFSLFEPHEAHLDRINPVLEREQENLKKFLHVICDSPHPHDEKAISFKNAFDIDLEVARLCRQFSDDLNPLLDALPAKYIASFLGELDVVFEEMKFLLKKFKNQQTKNRLYTKSENPHEEIIVRSTRGKEKDEREKRDSEKKRRSFSLDRLKKSHKSSAPKLSQSDND
uniref:Ras-GAP domain-containing protein n=1 Tax=Arcella intermedia TaxID=1963864 RepID=A0A6B2L1E0_9EUKA